MPNTPKTGPIRPPVNSTSPVRRESKTPNAAVLPKGKDPKEALTALVADPVNKEIADTWVIAVIAESEAFDLVKQPVYAAEWLAHARDNFNTDHNKPRN